ncbi:MAG: PKD domain-containing protein [Desulfobulbus sp.]|jgi:PKD repeat protein|uniref:PKD domain-containing protein n=1 Tax=Desulfobulbus sp. TaxID=895 RepID=UPI0028472712|nr:PKD domain-containing protein [Desulfobulbus sp.]MDR2549395.1 PKD domain-containing protein [Desulfobulbus sp.]
MKTSVTSIIKASQATATTTLLFVMLAISQTFAADFSGSLKRVTITDSQASNKPPIPTFTYTISGKMVTFDASTTTDPDGNITELHWNFGDGSKGSGANTTHQYGTPGSYPITLTAIDNNGAVSLYQLTINLTPPVKIAVNFQPVSSSIPDGYIRDSGDSFDSTKGYGWTVPPGTQGSRDRNSSLSPDQAYDTFIHVTPTAVWEYAVPNGKYHVTVTVGDPTAPDTIQGVQVEGAALISAESLSSSKLWITRDTIVEVTDNRLTLTFKGSTTAKICWIRIDSV